jgi:lipopolysaccharide cholinephosphotransferase
MAEITIKLPDSFYKEEIRNNYLVSSDMKKVWAVELDLFNQLDKICKKHNITYYADGGTLLGAVRHHGFIPWDDDMDFLMYRSDFDKLCEMSKEFKPPYFFQTEETDHGSLRCHAQLRNSKTTGILKGEEKQKYPFNQGIFIDIFPVDGVPENKQERLDFVRRLQNLKGKARQYYDYNHNFMPKVKITSIYTLLKKEWHFVKKIKYRMLWCFYKENNPYYLAFKKKVIKYDNQNTKFVMDLALGLENQLLYREDISAPRYVPFEMLKMPIPHKYNRILNSYYGDWHKMVKGENVHGGCIFDTDQPYTRYINTRGAS